MRRWSCLIMMVAAGLLAGIFFLVIPAMTARAYGPPAARLSPLQVIQYSLRLTWYDGLLNNPVDAAGPKQSFSIQTGEPVNSIALRLEQAGLIRNASALRDYLIYTGLDTSVQAGEYQFSPAMSILDVAHALQDATPNEIPFVVLPGWRLEEIAGALPTSGLDISTEAFLTAAKTPPGNYEFLTGAATPEGFLFPDRYILPRQTDVGQLIEALLRNFNQHLTTDLREGFARQGLSVYQAVTLASLVQREALHEEEEPSIASVYLNRLRAGMKLDADPTVQYALGYNSSEQTWWTSPLSLADLQIDSPYNTYLHNGLPPAPIANPGLSALRAVAFPADTQYYFFRARCDGSGYHIFSETFEQHLQSACP